MDAGRAMQRRVHRSKASYPFNRMDKHLLGIHQDFPELQGSSRQITVWAPFFYVDKGSGSLPVYNKKKGETLLPLELAVNPSGWQVCSEVLGNKNVFELNPGDVLLFNTFTASWRCDQYRRGMALLHRGAFSATG